MKAILSLVGVLLVLAISVGFWLAVAILVAIDVGPVPYAVISGLAASKHMRSCEARGERAQRMPTARAQ